jgi:hypothetical protein
MFAVGSTPWHGLGATLDNPPTMAEAIRLAGLDWEVALRPLVTADTHQPVPAFATIRTPDNQILGIVGPHYRPLQNADAFAWFVSVHVGRQSGRVLSPSPRRPCGVGTQTANPWLGESFWRSFSLGSWFAVRWLR